MKKLYAKYCHCRYLVYTSLEGLINDISGLEICDDGVKFFGLPNIAKQGDFFEIQINDMKIFKGEIIFQTSFFDATPLGKKTKKNSKKKAKK